MGPRSDAMRSRCDQLTWHIMWLFGSICSFVFPIMEGDIGRRFWGKLWGCHWISFADPFALLPLHTSQKKSCLENRVWGILEMCSAFLRCVRPIVFVCALCRVVYARQFGSLKNLSVWHLVLPSTRGLRSILCKSSSLTIQVTSNQHNISMDTYFSSS